MSSEEALKLFFKGLLWMFGMVLLIGPWIYHIVYCFKQHEYVLLIAGGIIPPIGWIHGFGALFGWW